MLWHPFLFQSRIYFLFIITIKPIMEPVSAIILGFDAFGLRIYDHYRRVIVIGHSFWPFR